MIDLTLYGNVKVEEWVLCQLGILNFSWIMFWIGNKWGVWVALSQLILDSYDVLSGVARK